MTATNQHSETKKSKSVWANVLLLLGLTILLGAECYCGYKLYTLSNEQEQIKEDYSMVNNITFGVFSVDLWREKLSDIVTDKIQGYKITKEQKADIREGVEKQLHGMVDQVATDFTKKQKSLGGKLKKFAFKQFVDPKEIHDQVPAFANIIVSKITSTKTTNKLKNIATTKFEDLAEQTYDSTENAIDAVTKYVYTKYYVSNVNSFNTLVETKLSNIRKVTYNYAYAMLGFAGLAVLVWLLIRKKVYLQTSLFAMSLLFALALLIVGVTVSIIEVDARLSSLNFLMLGDKLTFENQVLFFQSKSILGIAQVLISQPKPDSITVGVLIILFVIILPMLRIMARGIHMLCTPFLSENKVTRYLAFESAKWDMADVMVVGIIMTYMGLNGILDSQLSSLNMKEEFLTTSTVNFTGLQPGYIIFVGYVAFTIFLSYMLKKIVAQRCKPQENPSSDSN